MEKGLRKEEYWNRKEKKRKKIEGKSRPKAGKKWNEKKDRKRKKK